MVYTSTLTYSSQLSLIAPSDLLFHLRFLG